MANELVGYEKQLMSIVKAHDAVHKAARKLGRSFTGQEEEVRSLANSIVPLVLKHKSLMNTFLKGMDLIKRRIDLDKHDIRGKKEQIAVLRQFGNVLVGNLTKEAKALELKKKVAQQNRKNKQSVINLARKLKEQGIEITKAARSLGEYSKFANLARRAMKGDTNAMKSLNRETTRLIKNKRKSTVAVRSNTKAVKQNAQQNLYLANNLRNTNKMVLGFSASVAGMRANLLLVSFALRTTLAPVLRLGLNLVKTSAQFETYRLQLENVLQSTEVANDRFEKFKEVAATTPFDLAQVMEAGIILERFGENSGELIKTMADLAVYMNKTLPEAVTAYGRAMSGGVSAAKIFRNRAILQVIKDFHGVTELSTDLDEFREQMLSTFTDMSVGIAGVTDRMSGTITTAWSNMTDDMAVSMAELGDELKEVSLQIIEITHGFVGSMPAMKATLFALGGLAFAAGLVAIAIGGTIGIVLGLAAGFTTLFVALQKYFKMIFMHEEANKQLIKEQEKERLELLKQAETVKRITKARKDLFIVDKDLSDLWGINRKVTKDMNEEEVASLRTIQNTIVFLKAKRIILEEIIALNDEEVEEKKKLSKQNEFEIKARKEAAEAVSKNISKLNKQIQLLKETNAVEIESINIGRVLTEVERDLVEEREAMTKAIEREKRALESQNTIMNTWKNVVVEVSIEEARLAYLRRKSVKDGVFATKDDLDAANEAFSRRADLLSNINSLLPDFAQMSLDATSSWVTAEGQMSFQTKEMTNFVESLLDTSTTLEDLQKINMLEIFSLDVLANNFRITGQDAEELQTKLIFLYTGLIQGAINAEALAEIMGQIFKDAPKGDEDPTFMGISTANIEGWMEAAMAASQAYRTIVMSGIESDRNADIKNANNTIKNQRKLRKEIESINETYDKKREAQAKKMKFLMYSEAVASGALAAIKVFSDKGIEGPLRWANLAAITALTLTNLATISAQQFARGGDFVTSGPQMIMVGDNPGGQERVQVTPLSSPNFEGPQGGGSVNVTFSGNVMSQDFIEDEAIPMIKEAVRRGADLGLDHQHANAAGWTSKGFGV